MTACTTATTYPDLLAWFRRVESVLVAFSGGVDSTLLARAAYDALGQRALALTAVSASLAPSELEETRRLASQIGIEHRLERSAEVSRPAYRRNDAERCFHCKSELFEICRRVAKELRLAVIVDGTNAGDAGDHRPGRRAAAICGVRSPFVELDCDKARIRALSAELGLATAAKPEMACLASRFPTGTPITGAHLRRVAAAEEVVRDLGFSQYRVRFHGELARIELPAGEISRLAGEALRRRLLEGVRDAGFRFVTVDLAGYRRGSSNPLAMEQPVPSVTSNKH